MISKKIAIILFYSLFILLLSSKSVTALVVFSDNFDDGIDDGWQKIHYQGPDTTGLWIINSNKQYGMKLNTTFTVGQSVTTQTWDDIEYKLDMITVNGVDKNFVFRFNHANAQINRDTWYEIHSNASGIHLYKQGMGTVDDPNLPHHFPISNNKALQNGKAYNWLVRLISNNIKVYLKESNETTYSLIFDVTDNNNPFMSGKIGLRIGTGTAVPTEIYFDNITITDLSPQPTPTPTSLPTPTPTPTLTPTPMPTPTPTPLPTPSFPHFSQLDPQWKDLEYDNAYTNNNGYPSTMGQLSCAVTSASMLITKQGYPIGPDGQSTNPYSLNQYLTENNHYTKYSGVVWSGITKYVKDTKDNGLVSSQTPLLEFKYPTYSPSMVQNLLSQQIPSLLKTKNSSSNYSNHFVVLSDYNQSLDDFEIHDPLTLAFNNETLKSSYPTSQYVQTGYFSPSFTNLGYIWLYLHHQDLTGYIEYQSQKTGIQPNGDEITQIPQSINTHEERTFSPFVDPQTIPDNQKTVSRLIAIPKPPNGTYTIIIDSQSPIQPKDIELFTYDKDANHQIFEPITTSSSKFPQIFTLNYNADDISKSSLLANNHQASLEYLKNTIIHLRTQNHISDNKASQKLIEIVDNAIKHQNKSHIIVNLLSHPFKNQVQLYARKGDIDPTAYQEILLITNAVIYSLTP